MRPCSLTTRQLAVSSLCRQTASSWVGASANGTRSDRSNQYTVRLYNLGPLARRRHLAMLQTTLHGQRYATPDEEMRARGREKSLGNGKYG
ncbi:hypothetical protein BaRGS_00028873 [Batillaria attramentaria]|uniref:Uncharacterized protein n=1 Tax=Batillaria attramentaria TaxID=370345 RepID=A0ABD0JYB0_9CAEN